MTRTGTLLPILHEADWTGREVAACRALVPESADLPWMPLVAFAYDAQDRRSTVTTAGLEEEARSLDELAAEAVRNLVAMAIPLRPQGDGSVVAVHELASSLLVSKSDLDRVRALLGSHEVLLTVPARGLLVAIPRPPSGDSGLERFARENFARSLDTRVSPLVFAWDGDSLGVHQESVGETATGRLVELAYDEEDERLTLRLEGPFGPLALRVVERLLACGRDDAGKSVALVRLVVDEPADRDSVLARFDPDDVEVEVLNPASSERA